MGFWDVEGRILFGQESIPAPAKKGVPSAKWFLLMDVKIHHPLGFNWHPDWKVLEEIGFLYNFCWVNEDKSIIQ